MSYPKLFNDILSTHLKFKYFGFILIFILTLSSCSDSENDCLKEKSEILNKFNELIRLADDDEAQKAALIKQRDDSLKLLDC